MIRMLKGILENEDFRLSKKIIMDNLRFFHTKLSLKSSDVNDLLGDVVQGI